MNYSSQGFQVILERAISLIFKKVQREEGSKG